MGRRLTRSHRHLARTGLGRVCLVAVSLIAIILPSATFALVPAEFDAAVSEGGTTSITSKITHSSTQTADGTVVSPERQPSWGDYFTYSFTWDVQNLNEIGTVQQPVQLHVNFPSGAKPTSDVSATDLTAPADASTLWASSAAQTSATPNISLGESVACSGVFQFQWKVNAGALAG